MRVATEIVLTHEERAELTRRVRSKRAGVRLALRARTLLLAASGRQNKVIAVELSAGRVQVACRSRFGASATPGCGWRASSAICRVAHRRPRLTMRVWWS